MKRASASPSKTAVAGVGGTGLGLGMLGLVSSYVDMTTAQYAGWAVVIGAVSSGAVAWATPDSDVSAGRRARAAISAAFSYQLPDPDADKNDGAGEPVGGVLPDPE